MIFFQVQNLCLENYMAIHTEITPQMRGIVINWLIEVGTHLFSIDF
jgi:cyclin B